MCSLRGTGNGDRLTFCPCPVDSIESAVHFKVPLTVDCLTNTHACGSWHNGVFVLFRRPGSRPGSEYIYRRQSRACTTIAGFVWGFSVLCLFSPACTRMPSSGTAKAWGRPQCFKRDGNVDAGMSAGLNIFVLFSSTLTRKLQWAAKRNIPSDVGNAGQALHNMCNLRGSLCTPGHGQHVPGTALHVEEGRFPSIAGPVGTRLAEHLPGPPACTACSIGALVFATESHVVYNAKMHCRTNSSSTSCTTTFTSPSWLFGEALLAEYRTVPTCLLPPRQDFGMLENSLCLLAR